MDRPDERSQELGPAAYPLFHSKREKQFFGKEQQRNRRRRMPKCADQMIASGSEREDRVVEGVTEALKGTVKIRGRRVDKEEVIEALWNQPPASNKRIAQDQSGIVPDEPVARRRRVAGEHGNNDNQSGDTFLHAKNELDRINKVRV